MAARQSSSSSTGYPGQSAKNDKHCKATPSFLRGAGTSWVILRGPRECSEDGEGTPKAVWRPTAEELHYALQGDRGNGNRRLRSRISV